MKKRVEYLIIFNIILAFIAGCSGDGNKNSMRLVVGLESNLETLNPLYTMTESSANISELLYLGLFGHSWDENSGNITSFPVLAERYLWNDDSTSVNIFLKKNIQWSDGQALTTEDIVFSFDLYSDPDVQSRFYGSFNNYFLEEDYSIDLEHSFEIINPSELKINFTSESNPSYFDFDMPILPKHILSKVDRKELNSVDTELEKVSSGPYSISEWNKNQNLRLIKNNSSIIANEVLLNEIIFKIIPDYNSRLSQLKNNEIDLVENIHPEDVDNLRASESVNITARQGREYDYLGLNNIDPQVFADKGDIRPNKYFGDLKIRKAIAYAINTDEILSEYLLNNGEAMASPVAPVFVDYIDNSVKPIKYDIEKSKLLLQEAGWKDVDDDGIIEKDGLEFSFTISIPSGNPLRRLTSTKIKNNLKAVGIDAKIETLEPSVLFDKMFSMQLNSWIAGWGVPIPLNLKPYWYSDIEVAGANVYGFASPEIDSILERLDKRVSKEQYTKLVKEFQRVLSENQPVVFLFWIDNIVAFNNRIKNAQITPLSALQNCWKWSIE